MEEVYLEGHLQEAVNFFLSAYVKIIHISAQNLTGETKQTKNYAYLSKAVNEKGIKLLDQPTWRWIFFVKVSSSLHLS